MNIRFSDVTFLVSLCYVLTSCTEVNRNDTNGPPLVLRVSDSICIQIKEMGWSQANGESGIDNKLIVITNRSDTVYVDYGNALPDFHLAPVEIVKDSAYFRMTQSFKPPYQSQYVFVGPDDIDDPDYYRKHNVSFSERFGRELKIISPIREGQGIHGVHFYCIEHSSTLGCMKLNIWSNTLKDISGTRFEDLVRICPR